MSAAERNAERNASRIGRYVEIGMNALGAVLMLPFVLAIIAAAAPLAVIGYMLSGDWLPGRRRKEAR